MTRRRLTVLVFAILALTLGAIASHATPAVAGSGPNGGPLSPPTRLVIPKLKLDARVEPAELVTTQRGLEWEIPKKAVGWHDLSSAPGHAGNTVLSGHNATRGTRVFEKLWLLKAGDRFTVYVGDQAYQYVVVEREVFREILVSERERLRNTQWIGPFPDERVTLVTCHPTWTNTHRLVVVGKPLDTAK